MRLRCFRALALFRHHPDRCDLCQSRAMAFVAKQLRGAIGDEKRVGVPADGVSGADPAARERLDVDARWFWRNRLAGLPLPSFTRERR
jgi:hypothetical protein